MKNLTVLSQTHLARFGRPAVDANDIHHSVDPETGHVYVAYSTGPGEGVLIRISEAQSEFPEITELASFPPENDENADRWGTVVGVKFLVDNQAACVIFSHGDVALIHNEPPENGADLVEIVGSVDAGIVCMAWSPDEELVIMVTGVDTILEMTKDFDVISETPINVEEEGEETSVNVGWGKKETQFHGSEGKQAAQKKVDTTTFTVSPDDDHHHRLSWRGDGTLFCCSSEDRKLGRRVIRVYNREAILQTTSESVDMLEHPLSWRPSGNLIASSQRLPHRHDIVFFERNGLRHGEFTLREPQDTIVRDLSWNCDSTVLAVWLERPTSGGSCVQLWTMGNYKWYLKQELIYNTEGGQVARVEWDVEAALVLHVVTLNGSYQRNEYCWDHYVNELQDPENLGTVAVVDGANLMLTPFKAMNVPPPMSAFTLVLPYAIQHVSFGTTGHGDDMAVLLADQRVVFLKFSDKKTRPLKEPTVIGIVDLSESPLASIRQISWVRKDTLVGLQYDGESTTDAVVLVTVEFAENEQDGKINSTASVVSRSEMALDGLCRRLYFNQTFGDLILQQANGQLLSVVVDNKEEEEGSSATVRTTRLDNIDRLPEVCLWMGTTRIGTGAVEYRELAVVGQSRNNKLYVNDRLISSEATSYFLHNHFLIFTTASHTARFLPLEVNFSDFKIVDNSALPYDESNRRVERGSKIVLANQFSVNLILQMPRGNLETVAPRALVLSVIRSALDRLDFKTALVTCRKHRIDLNLLYDHSPRKFMENVGLFVEQVKEVDYLNLFLSFLRNEDVMVTLYPISGSGSVGGATSAALPASDASSASVSLILNGQSVVLDLANKVNLVCDAVRKELETKDQTEYMNAILTTYVRKSPPDLENALLLLAQLKDQDQKLAEDALKYTIFLADVDRLFDVALGMYDFALVLMVAQYSQKDPREYLPFLNELRTLEKYYQRFRIDDHLKKYGKALENLALAGEKYFEDCVNYIKKHNLFKVGLKIFAKQAQKHRQVLKIYADSLAIDGDHEQAGVAYAMAGDQEQALESYKTAGFWRESVVLAQQLNYEGPAMEYLASTLADTLRNERRFLEAGQLLADYGNDSEEAVAVLLEGRLWSEAIRVCFRYKRQDVMATHVMPGIKEGHHNLMESVREMRTQFDSQIKRLAEVRQLRVEKALADLAADLLEGDNVMLDNVDLMSDTTSMVSGFSRYTAANSLLSKTGTSVSGSSRTSGTGGTAGKQRRRNERKRARGKKGSVFEEEYLIQSLRKLILRLDALKGDVHALLKCLASFLLLDSARVLKVEYGQFLEAVKLEMPKIFLPPTTEFLEKKKLMEDAKKERSELKKSMATSSHLWSRQEEAVANRLMQNLEEILETELAEIYGEQPELSAVTWDVDLVC